MEGGAQAPPSVFLRIAAGPLRRLCALAALILIGACSKPGGPIDIALVPPTGSQPSVVRVSGLSPSELRGLAAASLDEARWSAVLQVRVAGAAADRPAVTGKYVVTSTAVEFAPRFPLDAGLPYAVTFDPSKLPDPRAETAVVRTVSLPKVDKAPSTTVTRILPTSEVIPENHLRMYVEFSAPMSRMSGVPFIRLIDDRGEVVPEVFLPLEADFWSPDATRYTVFFDPGRVKRGILPNEQMGRALVVGRTYAVEIDAQWKDADGLPLAKPYRQAFRVGPADERPVTPLSWTLTLPRAETRDPFIIAFPESLDHGLLQRAIGVSRRDGGPIAGAIRIDPGETRWNFTPDDSWTRGAYTVVVLSILEDLAGNSVGRLFEVDVFDKVDARPQPGQTKLPFEIR